MSKYHEKPPCLFMHDNVKGGMQGSTLAKQWEAPLSIGIDSIGQGVVVCQFILQGGVSWEPIAVLTLHNKLHAHPTIPRSEVLLQRA